MRWLFPFLLAVPATALLWWSTSVKYETRQLRKEIDGIRKEISETHSALGLLRAEWTYLNRPERLNRLASEHFETLHLMTLTKNEIGSLSNLAELQDRNGE